MLAREYGPYITAPEAGYDFSVLLDLDHLPADQGTLCPSPSPLPLFPPFLSQRLTPTPRRPQETRTALIHRISLLKRNAMAAPFERAFSEFAHLQDEAGRFTSESAPEGISEGGEVMAVHYRDEEAIYIKASHDRVTVIFSTVFREETDRIFGKVFLQEFVDARRRAIQNAPQVLFRTEPPLELQRVGGLPTSGAGKGEVGYVTFGMHLDPPSPSRAWVVGGELG